MSESPGIEIVVRDGRAGRAGGQGSVDGRRDGEVLKTFRADRPCNIGDPITLDDGTVVKIIGIDDRIDSHGWSQTVHIGTA